MVQFQKSIIVILLLISHLSFSQIQISFNVDSNPTPQISEWENRNELAILTVSNANPNLEGMSYKINAEIYLDQRLIAKTIPNLMPVMSLPLGTESYLADMIIPYDALEIYEKEAERETIIQTGLLPAGFYSFCIKLIDLKGNTISTPEEVCQQMIITDYQMPELISPIGNQEIPAMMVPSIIFRWTPLSPPPSGQDGVKYLLAVTQVQNGQSASQAFNSNYPIIEEEIVGSNQFYFPLDVDLPEENLHLVWSVKPMMLNDTPYTSTNGGFVNIGEFTIKQKDSDNSYPIMELPHNDYPILDLPSTDLNETEAPLGDIIHAGLDGEFEIRVTSKTEIDGKYTGSGTAFIDWLQARVAVKFQEITVNVDQRLLTGEIIGIINPNAPAYPQDWALEIVSNNNWVNNMATEINNWVESNTNQTIPYDSPNELTTPVQLPLGINMPSRDQIAITELVFRPNLAEINLVAAKNTPPSWNYEPLIGFKALGVNIRKSTITSNLSRIELIDNLTIDTNGPNDFILKKPVAESTTANPGCYIEWDENGFSAFGLEIEASFSRNWLVPSPDDGTSLTTATFSGVVNDWDDMVLTGSLPKSEIKGTAGITIKADQLSYDMSDTKNVSNIVFPDSYEETDETFRGFYAKNIEISLPEAWQTIEESAPVTNVENMIIDENGISMKVKANNVAEFKDVSIADLTASVDEFKFEMQENSLVEATIKGGLALPITDPDEIDSNDLLSYDALLQIDQESTNNTSLQLTINPRTIDVHFLKGEMVLDNTSNIVLFANKNKKTFDINLNGDYKWVNVELGSVGNINFDMGFEDISITYDDSKSSNKLEFNAGTWHFASPAKKMSGFPITIEEIEYHRLIPDGNDLLKGSLDFDVVINLTENIGGKTSLGLVASIKDTGNNGVKKFKPHFNEARINSVEVHTETPAVKIDGNLEFFNKNHYPSFVYNEGLVAADDFDMYGKGFIAKLDVNFKPANLGADALVQFGRTKHDNGNSYYRYWRVEAGVQLPPPGAVFLPGLAFRYFGGGAYYNMKPLFDFDKNKYYFQPKKNDFGFIAKTTIATSPVAKVFNTNCDMLANFTHSHGIQDIGFQGEFWFGAELNDESRREAPVIGSLLAHYNFPTKHFHMGVNAQINKETLQANGRLIADINGRTGKWYFKFGEPTNPMTASIGGVDGLYAYMMFGNNIETPPLGFSNNFRNAYFNVVGYYPGIPASTGVDANSALGKGFAFGAGLSIDEEESFDVASQTVDLNISAGAEINLSMLEYLGQNCANPSQRIGFNGYRTRGAIGFYATAGVHVNGNNEPIADFLAAGYLDGMFPRPSYLEGRITGDIRIGHTAHNKHYPVGDCANSGCDAVYHPTKRINGHRSNNIRYARSCKCCEHGVVDRWLINTHFDKKFHSGPACAANSNAEVVDNSSTTGNLQQDVASDYSHNLIQYLHTGGMNHDYKKGIAVRYSLEPNKVFDVAEQQADGSIIMRMFKPVVTVDLMKKTKKGYKNVSYVSEKNNLGEYIYIHRNYTPEETGTTTGYKRGITTTHTLPTSTTTTSRFGSGYTYYPPVSSNTTNEEETEETSTENAPIFKANTRYKLLIEVRLKEKINGHWIDAKKANGSPIYRSRHATIKTIDL